MSGTTWIYGLMDPAGIHDIPTEGQLFERAGREPLAMGASLASQRSHE